MTEQRLFISHASEDAGAADRIVAYLEARGTPCWISSRDIPPRAIYADAIAEAMQACSACAVIVSAASNASKAVKRELELASHYDKPFIPIRIDATEPAAGVDYYLRNTQWVDFKRDGERALDRILGQAAGAAAAAARQTQRAPARSQTSGGMSGRTLALVGIVALLFVGAGAYFAMGDRRTQERQNAGDVDLATTAPLLGSYNWEGVACGAGPSVTQEGDALLFAMPGAPTYRHDVTQIESGADVLHVETRVTAPAEHAGEAYKLDWNASSHTLVVTTGDERNEWTRCSDAAPSARSASLADSFWTGVWGEENAGIRWHFYADGRACGIYGGAEVCDWRWEQNGASLTIRSDGETWSGELNGDVATGQLRQGHGAELQAIATPKPFRIERQR